MTEENSGAGRTNGTAYHYVVSAFNRTGESANSSQASATPVPPPAPPANFTATAGATGSKSIVLKWTASSGAVSYGIKRSTSSSGTYSIIAAGLSGTSFNNSRLTAGRTYYYYVTATNASGTRANSNRASTRAR